MSQSYNNGSLLLVAILSLLNTFCLSTLVEKSVGPVASCHGESVSTGSVIKSCYHRCMMDPEPVDRANIELYKVKTNLDGPEVIECAKIKQRQTFTQTWSFSTIKSPVSHEFLRVTKEECDKAIADNCPDKHCNHRERDELEEEYHYASDTIKESTTISLISMPSSIQISGSVTNISPMSAKKYYSSQDGMAKEDGKIYLWDSGFVVSGCPYEPVTTYGCDMYQDSDKRRYYMCSGGRFSITAPDLDESDMSSKCPGMKRAIEGFIYKKVEKGATAHDHSRLAITQTTDMKADTDYLRHKVQQIATHLDSEICQMQCEILSVESRLTRKDSAIVRVGMNYYKMYDNGTMVGCLTLHGCRMTKPNIYCGNPPRIGVTCTENNGLWDPTTIELKRGGICMKPDQKERLSISLGSEHYIVDEGLKIHLNSSNMHGVYMTSFSDLHQSSVQWTISDLDMMKPEWDSQKSGKGGLSRSVEKNTTLWTPVISVGSSLVSACLSLSSGFTSVEHIVGFISIGVASLVAIWFAIRVLKLFKGPKTSPRSTDYAPIHVKSPNKATWA
ncbi:MAG: putative glycoprotein [Hainan cytorhabdovirus]|nr:MAG: putative glycoprotein [Hainan cytorhabdovirus]